MKWLLIGVAGIVVVAGLVAGWGALLPRAHIASSAITLRQPPDSVWAVVRDLGSVPTWWRDVEQSVRLPDEGGKERWEQQMGMGPMRLEIAESQPPSRLVTRIVTQPGADFGGTWTYLIVRADGGSRLIITEEGWVSNPIFRFLSYKVFGVHGTMDACLAALGARFGETVEPEHLQ